VNDDEFDRMLRERHAYFVSDIAEATLQTPARLLDAAARSSMLHRRWYRMRMGFAAGAAASFIILSVGGGMVMSGLMDHSAPPVSLTQPTELPPSLSIPNGYQRVISDSGMSTIVPKDWSVEPCVSGNGCEQADDPADSSRFIRFGGSPAPTRSLIETLIDYEEQFAANSPGYHRIYLQSGAYEGHESMEWEFEWDSGGTRRHGRGTYWRANGMDNFVYVSSPTSTWTTTVGYYMDILRNTTS
jgi:hypothetical protein